MKTDQLKMLSRKQYEEWLKSFPPDYCSFCDWPHNQITLHEGKNWIWIANRSPYWYWHTMLVTKRHVREFDQLSVIEAGELVEMYGYIVKKYREAELKRSDNSLIKKYVFFWRLRDDLYDPISGNMRPDPG